MSIIEQAAKRLEQLRRSGVELPETRDVPARPSTGSVLTPLRPTPVAAPAGAPVDHAANAGVAPVAIAQPRAQAPVALATEPARRSKEVSIDLKRLAAEGYLTPEAPRSQLADEFRVIKRPLLMNVLGKSAAPVDRANLIMVSSSLPSEGKTFTAINLAMSLASEVDTTVLLVDADVSRPSVLSRLGLRPARGLLDLLTQSSLQVSDVMMRTNIDKLSILPAGTAQSHATELLASDSMSRLVDELATRYSDRILIFDTPPLLSSTESRVLAMHMGQVVMVVAAETTPQNTVHQALATIEACPVVMTLLNKVPRSEVGSYYGYYAPAAE